jgi:hypothetical protein
MTAGPSTLHYSPSTARIETMSRIGGRRNTEPVVDFDLDRSREPRRRRRVLVSTQHFAELFEYHGDRGPSLH